MKEAHTYDMHRPYGITKVCRTTTDSGSDFVKAFSVFGRQESKEEEDAVATTTPHQLLLPPMTLHVGDITGASATRCSWSPTTNADHGRRPRGGHSRSEAVLAGSVCQDVGAVDRAGVNSSGAGIIQFNSRSNSRIGAELELKDFLSKGIGAVKELKDFLQKELERELELIEKELSIVFFQRCYYYVIL